MTEELASGQPNTLFPRSGELYFNRAGKEREREREREERKKEGQWSVSTEMTDTEVTLKVSQSKRILRRKNDSLKNSRMSD
jgi:hypothetical protein